MNDEAIEVRPLRVMVVDDDPSVRSLLKIALPLGDVEVDVVAEASDGNEAIKVAESVCPDLIILDHMMPRRTGASALPQIKRVSPTSDVIFFTAYLDAIEAGEALKRAAREYDVQTIAKGSLVDLEAAVAKVAGSRIF